jgi:N-acetylglucosaminyldiphosphoundecaprenol N-acetyl-beta-D-mannosaminyltransferase
MTVAVEPPHQDVTPDRASPSAEAGGSRRRASVLGVPIDVVSRRAALDRVLDWAARRESRVVCHANTHSVITARDDRAFAEVLEAADLATPDGMPVAWLIRALGDEAQQRVDGPDMMWSLCEAAAARGDGVFLYGGAPETLERLVLRLREAFPALVIAGHHSPPFRPLTIEEDEADVARINASGARLLFVGLGCPRQEAWMHARRGRIQAVMLGVGAAFDFHAGTVRRAPRWMRDNGLEWLHRLVSEPRRLWKRYLVVNTRFIAGAARQLLGGRRG